MKKPYKQFLKDEEAPRPCYECPKCHYFGPMCQHYAGIRLMGDYFVCVTCYRPMWHKDAVYFSEKDFVRPDEVARIKLN